MKQSVLCRNRYVRQSETDGYKRGRGVVKIFPCGKLAGVLLMIARTRRTTARNNTVSFVSETDYFLTRTFTKRGVMLLKELRKGLNCC